jgi:hypothetical protein
VDHGTQGDVAIVRVKGNERPWTFSFLYAFVRDALIMSFDEQTLLRQIAEIGFEDEPGAKGATPHRSLHVRLVLRMAR